MGKAQTETGGTFIKVRMKIKILSWNARGANNPEKRKVIKQFIRDQRVDLVCLQETKIQEMTLRMARSLGAGRSVQLMQRGLQETFCCFGIRESWRLLRR